MKEDIINSVKNCIIFSSLDPNSDVFQALIAQFLEVNLKTGEILFHQGDPSGFLYILTNGKLSASLSTPAAKPRLVGHILPIEPVGELGALSGDPRSLTLKATEDSRLLKLPADIFRKLCRQYPSILFETLRPVVGRSQQIIQLLHTGVKKKHIAIIPANKEVQLDAFEAKLREIISRFKKIAFLSETDIRSEVDRDSRNFEELIATVEENNVIIIYLLKSYETPLAKACWNRVEKLYIVANGNTKPYFDNFPLEKLHNTRQLIEVRRELVLLYKKNVSPQTTQEWLYKADFFLHHQIRIDHTPDYQRLLRFMRGKAFGLVLSGGGKKGWAHIGALRAILESNIPIDAIGGVSAGALVGSMYTLNYNYDETYQLFERLLDSTLNLVSFRNICWPAISLFSCEQFTREAQKIYGNKRLENMWLPFFCITCNLNTSKEAIHRSGLIWEKTRASVAIPGLVPPMVINGQMHIDGGVVNNLPVDVMRDTLGRDSRIIAVELMSEGIDNARYNFPPTLAFKEAFLSKLRIAYRDYRYPPFLETFLKSLLVGAAMRQKENSASADVLIEPDTRGYSMLRLSTKQQQNNLIDIGYQAAVEKLSTWDVKK